MNNKVEKIAVWSMYIASACFSFAISVFILNEIFSYGAIEDLSKNHGSLIAGLIAFLAAVIALYSQRESTQRQIDAQHVLEQDRLITSKKEELFEVVEGLRVKALLIRPHMVKDTVLDIDVLYHDVSKATMLCMLYDIADRDLFIEYRQSVEDHLANWSDLSSKMLRGIDIKEHDTQRFKHSSDMFFEYSKVFVNSLALDQQA